MRRPLDVVLYGASGFTGRLVARYLAQRGGVRVGLAGRSLDRLREVADEILKPRFVDLKRLEDRASVDSSLPCPKATARPARSLWGARATRADQQCVSVHGRESYIVLVTCTNALL